MLTRALVISLWSAYALASLAPLAAVGDDNDCALYLPGPGRTSAFDYSLNLLRGNFGYEGQHTCITYEAINQAYLDARKRILVSQPKGDWKAEDYASVGELILDISISLARTYGLTYEEIEKGLPLIDTSRTLIREVCPPVFSHVECRAGKYRRFDGLCNNLENPTWGATMAPFQRLIGPLFADGINAPRIAHTGRDLPLSRVVSRTMHPDDGFHDHAGTVMVIAWGQFMDHDYTLTGTPLDPINRNDPEECCKRPPHLKHPYCNEIRVPDDDYFYRLFGVKCIDFVRGFPSPRPGCRLGSRVPFNTLTGVLDGNTVYGVTEKFARKLRTGYGGLLRMNSVFKEYGLKDLLPLKLDIPDEGCTRPNKNMYCFEAGEIRVNEQLVLTVMHTLMAREHNRVAQALAEVNPHWDDETLFQEARRINIAEIQHITYNEFLPILLGKDVMEKFGLVLEKEGFWDGYDSNVNTDVIDAFASAAYRFGHSLLPTAVERWSKAHKFIASKRLSDLIRRPYDLYRAGVLDEYVMGLMNQVAQAMDDSITQEVTNHLFKKVGARFGMDLVSFNMQRGREFGIPGYMEFRKFCGLPGANSFQDLFGSMPNETVRKYESIFEHPIDVDLWSGGVSERPLPGSMLGPTFACIIATQFSYSRRGDRFWFELPNQPSSFTPEQLTEIRKSRLSRVICDNTDIIDTVQLYPMVLPDHELNPRVPCRSGIIPSMDFSKWAEPAPFQGAAKQFMTDAYISSYNETNLCEDTVTENIFEATETNNNKSTAYNVAEDGIKNNVDVTETETSTEKIAFDTKNSNITFGCDNVTEILDQANEEILKTNVSCTIDGGKSSNNCENITTTLDQLEEEHVETNKKAVDNSALLTFLLKNDAENTIQKPKGHQKNSLKRKKRSDITHRYGEFPIKSQSKLLNNDYKSTHHNKDREYSLPQQNRAGNIISSSNLADFNIETLHENGGRNKNIPEKFEKSYYSPSHFDYFKKGHDESNEKQRYKPSDTANTQKHRESDESEEKNKNSENIKAPHRSQDSQEISDEDYSAQKRKESLSSEYNSESNESREKNKPFHKKDASYTDSQESNEKNDRSHYLSISNKPNDKNQEREGSEREKSSLENEPSSNSREKYSYPKDNIPYSRERKDDDENRSARKKIQHSRHDSNSKDPVAIQDVDLGDFSYERIKVNDKGQVESVGEPHENNDDSRVQPNPITNISKTQSLKDTENTGKYTLSRESTEQPYNRDESDELSKPVPLNDGEIKPVVELNSESEEINGNHEERQKENFSNEEKSIENLSKDGDSHESNEKIKLKKNSAENDNLKQQFERIPLNYDHTKEEQKQNSESLQDRKPLESTTESSSEQNNNDKDTSLLITPRYDENLNIKFDDISIKLPEIKLPDDILAYNYDEPSYETDKEDQKQYNDDDSDNVRSKQKKKYDDDEDGDDDHQYHHNRDDREDNDENHRYGNYHQDDEEKQDYQNKKNPDDEEEQDVDLYEKFVRERFGKQGSFGKRSENLQEDAKKLPENPKLYETLQNILKKTAETEKEAEKSGDPNAGYMWTLEYGENL